MCTIQYIKGICGTNWYSTVYIRNLWYELVQYSLLKKSMDTNLSHTVYYNNLLSELVQSISIAY